MSQFDFEVVEKQIKIINREMTPVTNYLDPSAKFQVIESVDRITEEVLVLGYELEDYMARADGVKATMMALAGTITSLGHRKFLFNRLRSYLLIVRWFWCKERGYDVKDEPWQIEDEDIEKGEEEPDGMGSEGQGMPDIFTGGGF
jgi:hypothetical protein